MNNVEWEDVANLAIGHIYNEWRKIDHPLYEPEDLIQESYLTFRKVKEKYSHLGDIEFKKVFITSVNNMCLRRIENKAREMKLFSSFESLDWNKVETEEEGFLYEDPKDFYTLISMAPDDIKKVIREILQRETFQRPVGLRRLQDLTHNRDPNILDKVKDYLE
jgi:hypothetical protein